MSSNRQGNAVRDRHISELVSKQGRTPEEVAAAYGLTAKGVSRIVKRVDLGPDFRPPKPKPKRTIPPSRWPVIVAPDVGPRSEAMRLRELGLKVLELEAGPYTFLLVDCQPVAYADASQEIVRYYRTADYIRKGVTKAANKWLRGKPVAELPQADILLAFQGLSRFGPEPVSERRMAGRRAEDTALDPRVRQLADALVQIMGNGKQ